MNCTLDISVDRTFAGVRKIAALVNETLSGLAAEQEHYAIELALVEACTNAVKHSPDSADERIHVRVVLSGKTLELLVANRGEPFDFYSRKHPSFQVDRVETLPTGGMGIPLIRDIMDSVTYTGEEGYNRLLMTKYLEGPPEASAGAVAQGQRTGEETSLSTPKE